MRKILFVTLLIIPSAFAYGEPSEECQQYIEEGQKCDSTVPGEAPFGIAVADVIACFEYYKDLIEQLCVKNKVIEEESEFSENE